MLRNPATRHCSDISTQSVFFADYDHHIFAQARHQTWRAVRKVDQSCCPDVQLLQALQQRLRLPVAEPRLLRKRLHSTFHTPNLDLQLI